MTRKPRSRRSAARTSAGPPDPADLDPPIGGSATGGDREEELLLGEVSDTFEALVTDLGILRQDLADRMGVTPARVSQLLSGGENLTLRSVATMAWSLGLRARLRLDPLPDRSATPAANDPALPEWIARWSDYMTTPTSPAPPQEGVAPAEVIGEPRLDDPVRAIGSQGFGMDDWQAIDVLLTEAHEALTLGAMNATVSPTSWEGVDQPSGTQVQVRPPRPPEYAWETRAYFARRVSAASLSITILDGQTLTSQLVLDIDGKSGIAMLASADPALVLTEPAAVSSVALRVRFA